MTLSQQGLNLTLWLPVEEIVNSVKLGLFCVLENYVGERELSAYSDGSDDEINWPLVSLHWKQP